MDKNIPFIGAKMGAIAYVSVIQFIIGYLVGITIDRFFLKLFDNPLNTKLSDTVELAKFTAIILFQVSFTVIIAYVLRNIIDVIPYPLNGVGGYVHGRREPGLPTLKELDSPLLNISLFAGQQILMKRILLWYEQIRTSVGM